MHKPSDYYIDARIRVPILGIFIVLSSGKDRRKNADPTIVADRRRNSAMSVVVLGVTILLWVSLCLAIVGGGVLYLLKMKAGIDIFPGDSHPIPEFLTYLGFCH